MRLIGFAVVLSLGLTLAPLDANAQLPDRYVGWWKGISGKASASTTVTGRATVTKSFGHEIQQFEFKVAPDGTITGSGKAKYWFDVTSNADLLVLRRRDEAHLEGETQTVDFKIEGRMSADGHVRLTGLAQKQLSLDNDGQKQSIGAWNVFGPNEKQVKQAGRTMVIEASDLFPQINMQLAWKAAKFDCAALVKEFEFLEKKYLPFVETNIATYDQARTDPNVWKKLDVKQAQNWALQLIRKKYPKASVGAETTESPDGTWTTTFAAGEEPYPFIEDWRQQHEKYHLGKHRPDDSKMYDTKPYPEYVQWVMGNEVDAWTNVNKKLAQKHLSELKQEQQQNCGKN